MPISAGLFLASRRGFAGVALGADAFVQLVQPVALVGEMGLLIGESVGARPAPAWGRRLRFGRSHPFLVGRVVEDGGARLVGRAYPPYAVLDRPPLLCGAGAEHKGLASQVRRPLA